ncbi:MAG TPA: phosphatase PAP2 family protein, partial [Thermomicrobiales bacterium]|nr:phosphatase PAP2 family protein [Thermomicrobiales bacterium]
MATAVTFALGLVGFLLLPTAPPWMSNPDDVTRVTRHILVETAGLSAGSDQDAVMASAFRFEPNHLAAMPSIHVSVIVIVFLLLRRIGPKPGVMGAIYSLLMTLGVVYLGEHFVLDAIFGWGSALTGWTLACRWIAEGKDNRILLNHQHHPAVPGSGSGY